MKSSIKRVTSPANPGSSAAPGPIDTLTAEELAVVQAIRATSFGAVEVVPMPAQTVLRHVPEVGALA